MSELAIKFETEEMEGKPAKPEALELEDKQSITYTVWNNKV